MGRFLFLLLFLMSGAVVLAGASSVAHAQGFPELGIRVETVAENLSIPWEIDFAPDGRIFFTERVGDLRVIQNGILVSEPVISIKVSGVEGGLLGLALDPNFDENHHLYLYYSYYDSWDIYNRIVRHTERDNKLYEEKILVDGIPGSRWHDGGRIKFGPDGKLYATTGDATNYHLAQDLDSLAGKILRINPDGSIPDDNPFDGSPVFSYGHRNPQGIDWHPDGDVLVATDHGPSGERGVAHDEVNVVLPGQNHGWPYIIGDETMEGVGGPIVHTGTDVWAPSGAAFYDSDKIAEWHGKFFVATLRGSHLRMLDLDLENNQASGSEAVLSGEFGRLRSVSIGTDGHMYMLTSNRDGRGSPAVNDDRILRVVPLESDTKSGGTVMPPLKQTQSGVLPHDVSCRDYFELVIKASNGMPACVKETSVKRLAETGWAQQDTRGY